MGIREVNAHASVGLQSLFSNCRAAALITSVISHAPYCVGQWHLPHLGAAPGFSARPGRRPWLCGVHSTGSSYQWTALGLQGGPLEYQRAAAFSCPFSVSSGLSETEGDG